MIEISIIIAMAMSLTPIISEKLKINKKLRAWVSLLLIVILNVINSMIFGDHNIVDAMRTGIEQGVIAAGIYSTGKNTYQYVQNKKKNK